MKTLKEYADFLYKNGYKEDFAPYTCLNDYLEIVQFTKNGFLIRLYVEETEEFSNYLSSHPEIEYEIKYENYNVESAFIESPICNVSNFSDGSTDGVELVVEPNEFNKYTLDLFEFCINFQKTNLLEHELFIISNHQKHLTWAKDNLIPILEKYNYYVDYSSLFDTKQERCSSNLRIDFKHPNNAMLVIETDCITGNLDIWSDTQLYEGVVDLANKIYGKNQEEIFKILLEEVWKKDDLKFGYIYSGDSNETIETYKEVLSLEQDLRYKEKRNNVNFSIIPKRYDYLIEEYNKL